MSGITGPQGPQGPPGPQGPTGITGQNGNQGIRGFPGRPYYPASLQILQSSNVITSNGNVTRKFETAIPDLSSGNSTTISGLSNDSSTGNVTLPVGQYYIEAYANLSTNTGNASMVFNVSGTPTIVSSISIPRGTIKLEGHVTISGSPATCTFVQSIPGSFAPISPTYSVGYYGTPSPTLIPPNISVVIMKIV